MSLGRPWTHSMSKNDHERLINRPASVSQVLGLQVSHYILFYVVVGIESRDSGMLNTHSLNRATFSYQIYGV